MFPGIDPSRARHRLADGLLMLALLLLSIKMTYDVSRVRDLSVADEVAYMLAGSYIPVHGLPAAEYSPLYSLWYHGLSLLQPDRVRLFYLSWQILAYLVPASLYLLCRTLGAGRAVSLLVAFVVLTSAVVEVQPYPSHLACVVLVLGTALATRARSWPTSLMVLGLTLVLASYVRPELAVAFVALCLVGLSAGVWVLLRRRREAVRLVLPALVVLGCAGLAVRSIGNPLRGERSFLAFGQHYAANVVTAEQLPLSPWVHFEEIVARDFGEAATMREAVEANPKALLWHVWFNARHTPSALVEVTEAKLDLSRNLGWGLVGVLVAAVLLGVPGLSRRLARTTETGQPRRAIAVALLMLALVLVPTTASALLIQPRQHYLTAVVLFVTALVCAGLSAWPWLQRVGTRLERPVPLLGVFVVLLAVTPNRAHDWHLQALRQKRPATPVLVEQKIATTFQNLPIKGPAWVLDSIIPSRCVYTRFPIAFMHLNAKSGPFWDFVRRADVGIIVLDPLMKNDPLFRDDPEFQEFVSGRRTDDFVFFAVPDVPVRIAVRKHLLVEPAAESSPLALQRPGR